MDKKEVRTQLEKVNPDPNSSFRLLRNPQLNEVFLWHFHPEYELVYIDGADGTRHVGDHISRYQGSDLVFIGPNIPHLNFDYGVHTDYEKVVLQIQHSFRSRVIGEVPELSEIFQLFERAKHGIAFKDISKKKIGPRLKSLYQLPPFEQFLEVLHIFQALASSQEWDLLHERPFVNQYTKKKQERLRRIYAFVEVHYEQKITLDEVANLCHLDKSSFCRYFKETTGRNFTAFLNHYRINEAKRRLLLNKNVTETCYECGFESLSYFNRTFKKITNENPSSFKKRHLEHENRKMDA